MPLGSLLLAKNENRRIRAALAISARDKCVFAHLGRHCPIRKESVPPDLRGHRAIREKGVLANRRRCFSIREKSIPPHACRHRAIRKESILADSRRALAIREKGVPSDLRSNKR